MRPPSGKRRAQPVAGVVPRGAQHRAQDCVWSPLVFVCKGIAGEKARLEEFVRRIVSPVVSIDRLVFAADQTQGHSQRNSRRHVESGGHPGQSQLALVLEGVVRSKPVVVALLIETPVEVLDASQASGQDQTAAIDRIGIDKTQRAKARIGQLAPPRSAVKNRVVGAAIAQKRHLQLAPLHLGQARRVPVHSREVVGHPNKSTAHAHGSHPDSGEIVNGPLLLGHRAADPNAQQSNSQYLHRNFPLYVTDNSRMDWASK